MDESDAGDLIFLWERFGRRKGGTKKTVRSGDLIFLWERFGRRKGGTKKTVPPFLCMLSNNDLVIRYLDRVVVNDEGYEVTFKAGVTVEVEV